MNDNDSKDITFVYNNNDLSYYNIRFAFDKLLGSLATASEYKEFGDKREEYSDILKIVAKWSCEYEDKKTFSVCSFGFLWCSFSKRTGRKSYDAANSY